MDKHSHIIRQQVFEVNFYSREKTRDLQDKISSIFNNQLTQEMEGLFERVIPRDKLIRVDSLIVDIGNISFDALDKDLTRRVIEKLEEQLSILLLHDNSAPETVSAESRSRGSYLSLLEYYLLKGSRPWWAGSGNTDTPSLAVDFLLVHSAAELKALILKAGQKWYVRKRLVYQFPRHQLRSIISILEPAEAEFIFEYHAGVTEVQRKKQLVKSPEADFKAAVWEFILTYLIVDRGTHFNRKEFVKSTLRSMSAHFNISFRELLHLFGAALTPESLRLGNIDSLQNIILEISLEEAADNRQTVTADQLTKRPVKDSGAEISLLRYYLTFGSFPWWSEGNDIQELEVFMSGLIKEYPQTFESLIKSVGQRQYSRRLIVTTFKEELLHDILTVVEPANAGFIIDYVSGIKTTHTKKAVFTAQSEDLDFAVWEFILEFLFIDRGSEFNRQMFLESNIRRLAGHYNVSYREVLVFMVQHIAVSHYNSARHLSLFHGLSALYKISNEEEGPDDPDTAAGTSGKDPASSDRLLKAANVRNVLYFWLRSGYLPWWAGDHASLSPSLLLEKFIASSPGEAIIFLKYAGLKENTRKRLVHQVSFQTISQLFRLLPGADQAFQYSDSLLASLKKNDIEQSVYEAIILFALWNTLIFSAYTDPDHRHFIWSVLGGLSLRLGIPARQLISSFEFRHEPELSRLLKEEPDDENAAAENFDPGLLLASPENDEIRQLLSALSKTRMPGKKQADASDILGEAFFVLRYFLQEGKLPEQLKGYSSVQEASFLKQLLLLLFSEMPSELAVILGSGEYPGERFLFLHELFASPDSIRESSLSRLFASNIEKNILLYIRQKGGLDPGDSIFAFIGTYIGNPESRRGREFLGELLAYSPVALQLAYRYNNEEVYRLIENNTIQAGWGTGSGRFIRSFNEWLIDGVQDRAGRERLDLLFRAFNLMISGNTMSTRSPKEYISSFFKFLFERDYQLMLKLSASASAAKISSPEEAGRLDAGAIRDIKEEFRAYSRLNEVAVEIREALYAADEAAQKEIYQESDEQENPVIRALKKEQEEQKALAKEGDKDPFSDGDAIYIKNAGLVILHPFLSTYFNRLGMLEDGDFISEDIRQRAVHLLQYLVFGTEVNEEHELVLNKILCNIPLEEPVIPGIDLTEQEKTVSAELLNVVLVQWEKLKNTSADSLQVSFLQREGALSRIEENWNLKVEQKGYDVLLQTLPWGLGMIKTSWMSEFIYVEWM